MTVAVARRTCAEGREGDDVTSSRSRGRNVTSSRLEGWTWSFVCENWAGIMGGTRRFRSSISAIEHKVGMGSKLAVSASTVDQF